MKKINGSTTCHALSVFFFLCFVVNTILDYIRYNSTLNSAPFYIWVIVNAVYFLLPSVISFAAALFLREKKNTS